MAKQKMSKAIVEDRATYKVRWSVEKGMYVGTCEEFPALAWESFTAEGALIGVRGMLKQERKGARKEKTLNNG